MNSHHPPKSILNQLKKENHLNEEAALLQLLNDPEQLKKIAALFSNDELHLEQSIIEALNSIPVPDGLQASIMEKIRNQKKKAKP